MRFLKYDGVVDIVKLYVGREGHLPLFLHNIYYSQIICTWELE